MSIPLYNEINPNKPPFDKVEIEVNPILQSPTEIPEIVEIKDVPPTIETVSNSVGEIPVTPMKLQSEIVEILNARIGDEYKAHYFYRCATNFLKEKNYQKAAAYFEKESENELEHAKGLQKYMVDFSVIPTIPQVDTVYQFTGLVDILNKAYALELNLMKAYNQDSANIFSIDLSTFDFLQEYREIQRESVIEYTDLLNAASLIKTENPLDILYFENTYFN